MSTWKLQKLCYYSQAWSNGPVCPELFQAHKGLFEVSAANISASRESEPALTEDQKETIDRVLETYGSWQPYELREQSHEERPWEETRGNLPIGERSQTVIPKSVMGEYYGSL